MTTTTKLDAAINRMAFQLDRMSRYTNTVLQPIIDTKDEKVHEFFLQTTMVMLLTFLEEFFATLVGVATSLQPEQIRSYFKKYGNPEKQRTVREGCDIGKLWRLAEAECFV